MISLHFSTFLLPKYWPNKIAETKLTPKIKEKLIPVQALASPSAVIPFLTPVTIKLSTKLFIEIKNEAKTIGIVTFDNWINWCLSVGKKDSYTT